MSASIMNTELIDNDKCITTLVDVVNMSLNMFQNQIISNDIYLPKQIESIFFENDVSYNEYIESNIIIDLTVIKKLKVISINLININQNMSLAYLPELNLIVADITFSNLSLNIFPKNIQDLDIVYLSNSLSNNGYLLNDIKDYLNI